jgi:hypothetical protein
MTKLKVALRATVAALALIGAAAATPQAVAADGPAVRVSSDADAATKALARSNPEAVSAAATVCGTGYTLRKGIPLPVGTDPDMRLATLFAYENAGKGCAMLDNNAGSSQYMYLKVCKVDGTGCDTDSGTFSSYAGPVYVSSFSCAPVTAKMGKTSSSLYIDYKSQYVFPCG